MKKNYENCANKLFVIAFFICLSIFALSQLDRAIFISTILLKPENTARVNQYLPTALQIHPSQVQVGQQIEYTKIREAIEYRAANGFPLIDDFVKFTYTTNRLLLTANAQFQLLLGKHSLRQKRLSTLVTTGNHTTNISLNSLDYEKYNATVDEKPYVDYLKYFAQEMQKNSIEVLYIRRPEKIEHINFSPHIQQLIKRPNLIDLVYERMDGHMDRLELMDFWDEKWGERYDAFYKTDHHWSQLTVFRFFQSLSRTLEDKYGIEINHDYLKLDSYEQIILPYTFLGSTGRFIGYAGGELDDILILSPLFPTSFDVRRSSTETSGVGVFDQVFYDTSHLPPTHSYFTGNIYGIYNYREHPHILIKNKLNKNGKKVVMLNDSFASAIAPFLSLLFSELHMIDTRTFDGNIIDYIEEVKPDLVLIMNLPHMLSRQLSFAKGHLSKLVGEKR